MEVQEKEQLIYAYIDCYNNFDIDGMLAQLHDDVVFENESNGQVDARSEGKAEFERLARESAKLFSSRNQVVTDLDFDSNPIEIWVTYTGVIACDLPNGLKEGQTLELTGKTEFSFSDGMIKYIKDIS